MTSREQDRPEGWGVIGDWRQYFNDPAMDRLAEMVMDLAAATWTSIDRQRVLEWILESKGQLSPGEIDDYQPTEEQEKLLTTERNAFVAQILEGLARQAPGA